MKELLIWTAFLAIVGLGLVMTIVLLTGHPAPHDEAPWFWSELD
jgi:hypothetical protein